MAPHTHGLDSARYHSFAQRMPLQYALAVALTALKIYAFASSVPWVLGIAIPAALICMCTMRGLGWHRIGQSGHILTDEQARAELAKSARLVLVGGLVFLCYDMSLFAYSTTEQQVFVLVQISLLCVCQLFYLSYVPRVASLVIAMSIGSSLALAGYMGTDTAIGIALSMLAVFATLFIVVHAHYGDFVTLVETAAKLERMGEENARLASTDALTGLPNRREFYRALAEAEERARKQNTLLAVGAADLDGFKIANDTWGHKVGDEVLAAVAQRMQEVAGRHAEVYRLGGDEFAFIVEQGVQPALLTLLGEAMISSISQPISCGAAKVTVGCSIGIAIYPLSTGNLRQLHDKADEALYMSKKQGRGRVTLRRASLDTDAEMPLTG